MSILSICPNNLCVELLTVSNSSLCPTPHCVELIIVSNLSCCATCQVVQLVIVSNLYILCLTCHCVLPLRGFNFSLCLTCYGGGGGPATKKNMLPGKLQDVLCLFCSFLFFFKTRSKSTFLCVSSKKNKKIVIFVFFDLVCSFCRISLTKCPPTENKKRTKRSCRQEIPKMSFAFFVVGTPYRLQLVTHRVFVS